MTETFTLKGVDCPKCAGQIERSVRAIAGIEAVTLNSITSVLSVEYSEQHNGRIRKLIERAVHKHGPGVAVIDHAAEKGAQTGRAGKNQHRRKIARLITGAAVFAAGLLIEYFFAAELPPRAPLAAFIAAWLLLGGDVVWGALKKIFRGDFFDENFLMSVATAGAFIIGEYPEAAGVMLFYQIGELFQDLAVRRSKKSISALMDIRPDFANLIRNGKTIKTAPGSVNPGDIIVIKPGEKIPLDGEVIEGRSMLDTTALTGESVPREAAAEDTVLSGCVNLNGVLTVRVTKTFGQSTAAKIIDLVENAANKKAPTENFITGFSRYYTPAVVALAALIALVPPLLGSGSPSEWINRGLIFLVISCPCALVISIPLSFFGGIGGASRKGILVKGGNYLEALNNLALVVFDKTGTLTKGVFKVSEIKNAPGFTKEQLLEYAAKAESFSNHPIARSIQKAWDREIDKTKLSGYNEIAGRGISVKAEGKTILAGNGALMAANGIAFTETPGAGTKVYAAVDNVFAGCIVISDEVKEDSANAIAALKEQGVRKTVMLTGDSPEIAAAVAGELGLDEYYGGLLPHEKVAKVEALLTRKKAKEKLAFIGDGINDAPALARADIGIAMGGLGSDAAIEAADVVLMTDEPSKLAEAVDIARFTKRVVRQNIVIALGIKGAFMILGALGLASMWEAVFADVGVALLAILNASRVITAK